MDVRTDLTQLIRAAGNGDEQALDALLPMVYDQLRGIARKYLAQESSGHTLAPTALVHEAYVKLRGSEENSPVQFNDRIHFFALAARIMRNILINHAHAVTAEKRGGGAAHLTLSAADQVMDEQSQAAVDVMQLDQALHGLQAVDERAARIVEMRYFAGMSNEEVAQALDVSLATVKRDWQFAKIWLKRVMSEA